MDLHPENLAVSIVSTLIHDLKFSFVKDEALSAHDDTMKTELHYDADDDDDKKSSITLVEREKVHYPNVMWASFSRWGNLPDKLWLMNLELGVCYYETSSASSTSEDTIAIILRMEFIENPMDQPDNTLYFMETDISSKNDWDQILVTDLVHWIQEGLAIEHAYKKDMSENETEHSDSSSNEETQ